MSHKLQFNFAIYSRACSLILACTLALVSTAAFAEGPFRVLFDFSRLTGDRDCNLGERQPTGTFDNYADAAFFNVNNSGYLSTTTLGAAWILLNDTNPDVVDSSAPSNSADLIAGTNVLVRTRIERLVSGTTTEFDSAGILFGMTGTGANRSGFLARVDRTGNTGSKIYIDAFTNGVRGANLAVSSSTFNFVNNLSVFLELRITSDGVHTNAALKVFLDASIPGSGSNIVRLVDAAFNSASPASSITLGLTNYTAGFLGLYFEDNSGGAASNPVAGNGRFSNFYASSGSLPLVSIVATDPVAAEGGDSGTFVFTRTFDDVILTNVPVTVSYAVGGTASNGVDYPTLSGQITIPIGQTNVVLTVTPIDDSESELTETLTLTLLPSANYFVGTPSSATMVIFDNDPTKIGVFASDTNACERAPLLTAEFTLVRYGLTNTTPSVNLSYSGATLGVDFSAATTVNFAAGEITKTVVVTPIDNTSYNGDKSLTLTVVSGTGYTPASDNTATVVIVDDELPPETVLWSDNFDSGISNTNYLITAASRLGPDDYSTNWFFDYLAAGIPSPPHGSTNYGLQLSANKAEATAASAAVNFYPRGQSFSNNFALRFDLFLNFGSLNTAEYAIFGINHTGLATNWTSGSFSNILAGDGIWAAVSILPNTSSSQSVTMYAPTNIGGPPAVVGSRTAGDMVQIFNSPPFTVPGGAGNINSSATKTWLEVELNQIGSLITLKLNNTPILQFTNTTAFTNGNIMIGYNDAFDSIGSLDGYAVFDNVRVVALPGTSQPVLTHISVVGGTVTIDFTAEASDVPGNFKLQTAGAVVGPYGDDNTALITGSGGNFQATTAVGGSTQFYRIRRQ
jgi:hypothetical protein